MEKKFSIEGRDCYLRWFWPDRFELQATLHINNPDAFREFLKDFNERHPALAWGQDGARIGMPDGGYLKLLIEEYLGA